MKKITFKNGQAPYMSDTTLIEMQDNIEEAINEVKDNIEEEIDGEDWQDFSWTNSDYIGTTQSSYTMNKWRVKAGILFIAVGVGSTENIDTSTEYEIARIPIIGNTSFSTTESRIWNGAVGVGGTNGGFLVVQNTDYISIYMKPHTDNNGLPVRKMVFNTLFNST